jgi:hypothetical protein
MLGVTAFWSVLGLTGSASAGSIIPTNPVVDHPDSRNALEHAHATTGPMWQRWFAPREFSVAFFRGEPRQQTQC